MANLKVVTTAKRSKYGNRKTVVDGITFHSKKEAEHYRKLKLLHDNGRITDLRLQVRYHLHGPHGARITTYVADFVYVLDGDTLVVDVKGHRTSEYKTKRKWMQDEYGIKVVEV